MRDASTHINVILCIASMERVVRSS